MIQNIYKIQDYLINSPLGLNFALLIDGEEIDSEYIVAESFELKNAISDESELKLGGCIISEMRIQLFDDKNVFANLTGKKIEVKISQDYTEGILYPNNNICPSIEITPLYTKKTTSEVKIFCGFVNSVKRQKNRRIREIIAYDELYKLSTYKARLGLWRIVDTSTEQIDCNRLFEWIIEGNFKAHDPFMQFINSSSKLSLSKDLIMEIMDNDTSMLDILKALCEMI